MKLWPHQIQGLNDVQTLIEKGARRIAVTSPTGMGKTRMMMEQIKDAIARNWNVVLYTNRRMLFEQTAEKLQQDGIYFGKRASGHKAALMRNVQLASIQTEWSRCYKKDHREIHKAQLVLVDEAHVQKAEMATRIIDDHADQGAIIVGYTATPLEIGGIYDDLVVAGTVSDGRKCNALVPAYTYGPDEPDMRKVKPREDGEFSEEQVRKAMPASKLFGRVHEWLLRLNPDLKPTMLFAPGVPESLYFAMKLTEAGIRSAHIDGDDTWIDGELYESSPEMRDYLKTASEAGDIKVICNRFVMREGADWPWLAHGILATVFGSPSSYIQAGGRFLRKYPGLDHVTIQDHGGNWWRHGSLNADREWDLSYTNSMVNTLRGEKIRESVEPAPIVCPQCKKTRVSDWRRDNKLCPFCGYRARKLVRMVMQSDGQLKELSGNLFPERRRKPKTASLERDWERMYWRSRKAGRTFTAAEALFAMEHNWQWPDRTMRLMPTNPFEWLLPVGDVPMENLTDGPTNRPARRQDADDRPLFRTLDD